jgi:beta-galactosidase
MAHGGTNFGFFSGANTDSNDESAYKPDLTSYDYVFIQSFLFPIGPN